MLALRQALTEPSAWLRKAWVVGKLRAGEELTQRFLAGVAHILCEIGNVHLHEAPSELALEAAAEL